MTSKVLTNYEEGTWTPVATGIVINTGTPVWTGTYTRVGRQVTATWGLTGGANINVLTSSHITLPFTAMDIAWGNYGNSGSNIYIGGTAAFGADMYFGTAIAGATTLSGTISFQV